MSVMQYDMKNIYMEVEGNGGNAAQDLLDYENWRKMINV